MLECQCLRPYKYVQMGTRSCLFHAAANVRAGQLLYQNDVHRSFHLGSWKSACCRESSENASELPESVFCASSYLVFLSVARAVQIEQCGGLQLSFLPMLHSMKARDKLESRAGLGNDVTTEKMISDTLTSSICMSKIRNYEDRSVLLSS